MKKLEENMQNFVPITISMLTNLTQKVKSVSQKIYWREILACLLLVIGIYFLRKERTEVTAIVPYLRHADKLWLLVALAVTIIFTLLQSAMYVNSFSAIRSKLKWKFAIELFLKRNLLGVFLPGGGVSALAFVPNSLKKTFDNRITIHQASGLFAFAGMLSTFLVGLPVLFMNTGSQHWVRSVAGLTITAVLIALLFGLFRAIKGKGRLFHLIDRRFPKLAKQIHEITDASIDSKYFGFAIANSVGVEVSGIVHLYLAMLAIGAPASLTAAGIAYIVSLLLMVASPFLKGLGAVELSIVYILSQFGYAPSQALAITLIYRTFEFWLPLAGGTIAFLLKGRHLFFRIAPALSIFLLGIVNIVSVVTPPIAGRLHYVKSFIPSEAIHASNLLVLFIGVTLMVTAAFLLRGLRNAWWIAISISFVSIFGHLAKALDYEEAIIAVAVFCILLFTRRYYKLKGNPKLVNTGLRVALLSFAAVLIYGFIGFYFLEKKHFGIDFTWRQSLINAARGFLLLEPGDVHPLTRFGKEFLRSFYVLGLTCWAFLLYALIRPYLHASPEQDGIKETALRILEKYGRSAVDYFKLADDKRIYLSQQFEAFVSYSVSGTFAIVLEEPVCAPEKKVEVLQEFERYCHRLGLRTAFYRVDEASTGVFTSLKKKRLVIGQEALLDVNTFDLAGRAKKSLRNGLNSLQKKGFTTTVCSPPHSNFFLAELKSISDEWLEAYDKKELVFAQGEFDENVLRDQPVIATFDADGKVVAFLNIIPDFAPEECTYDLIRKTESAPGGCMDALIIELIQYAKQQNIRYLNMGLVPMAGITQPESTAEQVIRFAYHKVKRFKQYQGLREFKEKYATRWVNKYLIYENDFDLLQLPVALNRVMQPGQKASTT